MSQAEVYDALEYVARTDGYAPGPGCDRGLGVWQSRWRFRQIGLGRPGRFRLRGEVLVDRGNAQQGWTVRYLVEQQKVKDLRYSMDPREEDWSNDGQDDNREETFGERLRMRLGVRSSATPGAPSTDPTNGR